MTPFYVFSYVTMKILLLSLADLRVVGRENVPASGPLIVVSNHLNIIDPPLLGAVIPRGITFMAKEELFYQPIMSTVVKSYGAFPVKRNKPDRTALRRAQSILAQGGVLGMFPEGKRNPFSGLSRAEAGVALIATRSGAPILPVAITGSEAVKDREWILRRPRIGVTIGQPFTLFTGGRHVAADSLSSLADQIMQHIASLLPERYQGVYADKQAEGTPEGRTSVQS